VTMLEVRERHCKALQMQRYNLAATRFLPQQELWHQLRGRMDR
jgi:hypothetical protein